ncbi:hypothetical protein Dfri01_20770 [Dyadobacter frigoris]|nr:hypothetical protein Dfri01_20770 [Dyadobacter frigoris]
MEEFFDFQLYSDETGMSKPNRRLFELMVEKIYKYAKVKNIDLNEIIHIGDNLKADIEGARSIGIRSLLINSNHTPILSLVS